MDSPSPPPLAHVPGTFAMRSFGIVRRKFVAEFDTTLGSVSCVEFCNKWAASLADLSPRNRLQPFCSGGLSVRTSASSKARTTRGRRRGGSFSNSKRRYSSMKRQSLGFACLLQALRPAFRNVFRKLERIVVLANTKDMNLTSSANLIFRRRLLLDIVLLDIDSERDPCFISSNHRFNAATSYPCVIPDLICSSAHNLQSTTFRLLLRRLQRK